MLLFEKKQEKYLIFSNGTYCMGPRGVYLNNCDMSINIEKCTLYAVLVWVKLPHFPLHCWCEKYYVVIGNNLGKYIDKSKPKPPMFTRDFICVEFDLEKGLSEAIRFSMHGWKTCRISIMGSSLSNSRCVMNMGIRSNFPQNID